MRGLVVSLIVFLAATAAPALAAPQTPILFDAGLRCPGTKTGVNMSSCKNPKYNARIYEIKKIGFPEIAITNGAADDTHPVWSPNHKRIAFYRAPQATGTVSTFIPAGSALWLMNADGSGQKKVSTSVTPSGSGSPSWSSDGTHLIFPGKSPDRKTSDIYAVKTDGTGLTDLTSNPDNARSDYPSASPDGGQILFRHLFLPTGSPTTWTMKPDGKSPKSLLLGGIMYAWRPDSARFAYVANDNHGRLEIFVANANGTGTSQITTASQYSEPSWSPDGTQLVLVRANQITRVNADGSGIKQLTKKNPADFFENPSW